MESIIIRLPDKNMLLYKKGASLYIANADKSNGKIILNGCTDCYDAVCNTDGVVYIICKNQTDVFLYTMFRGEVDAKKLELHSGSSNFRLHIIGSMLCLGFTEPIGGGRLGLYHILLQADEKATFISRCATSERPFCSVVDRYGNITYVFATHDACINAIEFIWSQKNFSNLYNIGTHQYMATSPHAIFNGDKLHCTYMARDDDSVNIMYYNNTSTEVIYNGCYGGALPVLFRKNEKINIMWNQFGCTMVADTWDKLVDEVEEKKYFSEPAYIGVRLPIELSNVHCTEVYAREMQTGYQLLVVNDIITEDLSELKKPREIRQGEELEKFIEQNGFEENEIKIAENVEKSRTEIEFDRLGIRISILENGLKDMAEKISGLFAVLAEIQTKQASKPRQNRSKKTLNQDNEAVEITTKT